MAQATDVFSVVKARFQPPNGINIPTVPFLEAASEVPFIVGTIGTVLTPIKYDIAGNVKKLKEKHAQNPEKFVNLFDMVEDEGLDPSAFATESLLWLKRGMEMFRGMMLALWKTSQIAESSDSLCEPFREVYRGCLEPYHGWVTRNLFSAGMRTIPGRTSMVAYLKDVNLSPGTPPMDQDAFFSNLKSYVDELSQPLDVIIKYFDEKGLNSRAKV